MRILLIIVFLVALEETLQENTLRLIPVFYQLETSDEYGEPKAER